MSTVDAIKELLRLKDLKERLEACEFSGPLISRMSEDDYKKGRADDLLNKEKAWGNVRKAITAEEAQTGEHEFLAIKLSGKQHDTGRVTYKNGGFFADACSFADAQLIAGALNRAKVTVITDEMAMAGYNAMRDPVTSLPAPWIVLGTAFNVFEAMMKSAPQASKPTLGKVPEGFIEDILTCASQFSVALKTNDVDKIKGNSMWMNELILKGAAAASPLLNQMESNS